MAEGLRWWFVVEIVGLAALPLCLLFLRRLPDRGYALSKPFALILLGYVFWLLNSIGLIPNTRGGLVLALVLLLIASGVVAFLYVDYLVAFFRRQWPLIVAVEGLFL